MHLGLCVCVSEPVPVGWETARCLGIFSIHRCSSFGFGSTISKSTEAFCHARITHFFPSSFSFHSFILLRTSYLHTPHLHHIESLLWDAEKWSWRRKWFWEWLMNRCLTRDMFWVFTCQNVTSPELTCMEAVCICERAQINSFCRPLWSAGKPTACAHRDLRPFSIIFRSDSSWIFYYMCLWGPVCVLVLSYLQHQRSLEFSIQRGKQEMLNMTIYLETFVLFAVH